MNRTFQGVPVIGFIAASGTGKTTLISAIIAHLRAAGLRVGCIKHTHHAFEIDHPGKDSHALRKAGAEQMLIGSSHRWALIVETAGADDGTLDDLLARLDLAHLDVVLVEGFKLGPYPMIEVQRCELGRAPLYTTTPAVIALATNQDPLPAAPMPAFDLDQPVRLAEFIRDHVQRCADLRGEAGSA